jgi:hypothetical protein
MKLHFYALSLAIICLPACTWVEPTKESSEVTLVKAFNVKACKKLGTTTATVKQKVGIITRGEETVLEELTTLAKNRAATMGGDSIVAKEPAVDGVMSFDIYKCSE